jgi:hypothetical protein
MDGYAFNPPPGWPTPPPGWVPPAGWKPDPSWPPPPAGWAFWVVSAPAQPVPPPPGPVAQRVDTSATATAAVDIPAPTPRSPPTTSTPPQAVPAPSADNAFPHTALGEVASPGGPDTGEGSRSASSGSRTEDPEPAAIVELKARIADLERQLQERSASAPPSSPAPTDPSLVDLDDERVLQEVGIYRYHHPVENSQEYRDRLQKLQDRIKESIKRGDAVLASDMFTFNGSLAKGRRMTSDYSKLMLRAYNAEADTCVRSLRAGNVVTAKRRLEASVTAIAKLGAMMEMRINPEYHSIRLEELELTSDFLIKVQEEREAAREERERLREERKVEQELAAERERLDKERAHYANALEALKASADHAGIAEVTAKLESLDQAIAQNDYRAANIRAGYVYVISNAGAFGPRVVKIGMTRRLEPMDRVRELGGASVPFPFDVHALFFSADAVTLETELHHAFASVRLNHVNERREFFFASPGEVRTVLGEKVGNLLEFTDQPEATQFLQSKRYWPAETEQR